MTICCPNRSGRSRNPSRWRHGAMLLVTTLSVGIVATTGAFAQELLATPLPDEPTETPVEKTVLPTDNFAPVSTLSLTLDTESINFGEVVQGGATHIEDAVVVTVSGAAGSWHLLCTATPTGSHTTSATVDTLAYAPADSVSWTPFQSTPIACAPEAAGDAIFGFDYLLTIPPTASTGVYDVIVTYTVETLE